MTDETNIVALPPGNGRMPTKQTVVGSFSLTPTNMREAMQLAEMMASARLVPIGLQKSPADCLMVIQQAVRWEMDPFAVAQECSVIQGKLMHSGKLVAAVINSRGNLAERLNFSYEGADDNRSITVSGRIEGEAVPRTVTVKLKDARTPNSMWTKQPDQQLMYHGTRVWARRHTPELMLGVYSPEEFPDPTEVKEDAPAPRVLKKDHRADYFAMLAELDNAIFPDQWEDANYERIKTLPLDWQANIKTAVNAKCADPTVSSGEILGDQWGLEQGQKLHTATQVRAPVPPDAPDELVEDEVPSAKFYTELWDSVIETAKPEHRASLVQMWAKERDIRRNIYWTEAHPCDPLISRVAAALKSLKGQT